ncbi:MAG: MarR family winged helix-turn-helix transcriptional regulator [Solirubrobacterales bacterium]
MNGTDRSDRFPRVLSLVQVQAVEALTGTPPQSLRSIGAAVGVSTGLAAALVDALERLGLAQRWNVPEDERGGLVTLTMAAAAFRELRWTSGDWSR